MFFFLKFILEKEKEKSKEKSKEKEKKRGGGCFGGFLIFLIF
jgi:hypothetical protein